jgi:hypothetical protein
VATLCGKLFFDSVPSSLKRTILVRLIYIYVSHTQLSVYVAY